MNDVNNIVQKYSRTQIYGVTVIMFGHETVMLKNSVQIIQGHVQMYSVTLQ